MWVSQGQDCQRRQVAGDGVRPELDHLPADLRSLKNFCHFFYIFFVTFSIFFLSFFLYFLSLFLYFFVTFSIFFVTFSIFCFVTFYIFLSLFLYLFVNSLPTGSSGCTGDSGSGATGGACTSGSGTGAGVGSAGAGISPAALARLPGVIWSVRLNPPEGATRIYSSIRNTAASRRTRISRRWRTRAILRLNMF